MRVCMLSHFSRVQLFVTPWTVAHQAGSSVHGILQARYWCELPWPPPEEEGSIPT